LLDRLNEDGQLRGPVNVMGESYGAALALRWKASEPRVQNVVAIAPYAVLSNAVVNIRQDYAPWAPAFVVRMALKRLPALLKVPELGIIPAMRVVGLDLLAPTPRTPIAALGS